MHLRKSPRLPGFDYRGGYAYSLTLVTRGRSPVFKEARTVEIVRNALNRSSGQYSFEVLAYCFMPDHLHLLASGTDNRPLTRFIQHFKQLSGYTFKRATGTNLWQMSYWDRVLRSDEDLVTTARYIWNNPVRAGWIETAEEYPFSGPRPLPEVI